MENRPDRTRLDVSLVQQKQQTLARMRVKLADPSQVAVKAAFHPGSARHNPWLRWGTLAVLAAALAAGALMPGRNRADGVFPQAKPKRVHALPAPATLTPDEQALYWTYALYDFDRLRTSFGVSHRAVVNAALAQAKLDALLPKVEARTRSIIDGYLPKAPGKLPKPRRKP